ncbi:hypothetical protein KB206_07790 [Microvirga sp. STS02]|uniref:hypothetical protein n=1 Tax=Hymenobacter negativus TaxID=2795026 RepID=UPI0018DCAB7E|nr:MULTISPECIES: hypothetical protein [Bacteria]MBH8568778.1 hypothetical protein [Hymenobacter negativus]MBR7208512.1 hypothetical protein [Microvirga sp. STS02]
MRNTTVFRARWARLGMLVAAGLLVAPAARAQTNPAWASVQRSTSPNGSFGGGLGLAVAADGSCYATGSYSGTLTLGSTVLTAGSGAAHFFLAKYSATGSVLWARSVEGSVANSLNCRVAVDGAGNAFIAGFFTGTVTVGGTTLTDATPDSFLAKFDAQGQPQWVRQGGAGTSAGSLATDASGNVAVVGYANTAVTFGGPAVAGTGVFYYKFSPVGGILQSRFIGTGGWLDNTRALTLDAAGNAYLVGAFSGTAQFGAATVTSLMGSLDVYLCKLDATGTPVWTASLGGAADDTAGGVAVDASGSAVVCASSAYVEPGSGIGGPLGSTLYLARFTPQGAPLWERRINPSGAANGAGTNSGPSLAFGVAYDGRGGCYIAGRLRGTATFGATTLYALNPQLFVVRYDGQGNAVWASQSVGATSTPGTDGSSANGIGTDAAGNAYLTGSVGGTVAFGPLVTTPSTGSSDVFVATLTPGSVLTAARPAAGLVLAAYPNPASGSVTLRLPVGGGQLAVLDAVGRTVRQQALPASAGDCPVPLTGLAPGLYQLRATLGNGQPATAPLLVR